MKIFFNFSNDAFLNSYIVANEKNGQALLIDPLRLSMETINLIENHHFALTHILFTHGDEIFQRDGILTACKIYPQVTVVNYALSAENTACLQNFDKKNFLRLSGDGTLNIAGFTVEYFAVSGLTSAAHCYKIENAVFCGKALIAGQIGKTSSTYATQNLQKTIREKIFLLPDTTILFPMNGAPTSIAVEKIYNTELQTNYKERRHRF